MALSLTLARLAQVVLASDTRPHLVFVLADDQGHNNFGGNNAELITPNTHALLNEGVTLTNQYVYKFCSPTRCSFLSGRLPIHVNQENSATEQPLAGVPLGMTTIAEVLKPAGYATAHIGKWHCGQATTKHIPAGRGFDSSLSFFNFGEDHYTQVRGGNAVDVGDAVDDAVLSRTPQLDLGFAASRGADRATAPPGCAGVDLWRDHSPAYGMNGTYGGYTFVDEATRVIETHAAKNSAKKTQQPLFMFIAFQNNHPPLQVPQEYIERYSTKALQITINGMTTFLDESVGNVTRALKSAGMWERTLLVYSADNGGYLHQGGDDAPLRGGKFSDFQGGTRVVSFASGGYLPASVRGTTQSGLIHIADWYATFASLAGVSAAALVDARAAAAGLPALDSINVWALVSGSNVTSPRTEVPLSAATAQRHNIGSGSGSGSPSYFVAGEGLIVGTWKLIVGPMHIGPFGPKPLNKCGAMIAAGKVGWNITVPGVPCDCGEGGCLFNLDSDPYETSDVAAANPSKVKELMDRLVEIRTTVYSPDRGALDPAACAAIHGKWKGFWGPWLPAP